jgi:hypothetical protein
LNPSGRSIDVLVGHFDRAPFFAHISVSPFPVVGGPELRPKFVFHFI